jgi:hypothetical protein
MSLRGVPARVASGCRLLALVGLAVGVQAQAADGDPTIEQITKAVSESVDHYTASIACERGPTQPKDIAALLPYKLAGDRDDEALWAVLWHGDIGCRGGSGTSTQSIALVRLHIADTFLVDPAMSSPQVRFDVPVKYVDHLVGNTGDTLVLEGMDYGDHDAQCCPSVRKRFTMKMDEQGNWKTLRQRVIADKK